MNKAKPAVRFLCEQPVLLYLDFFSNDLVLKREPLSQTVIQLLKRGTGMKIMSDVQLTKPPKNIR